MADYMTMGIHTENGTPKTPVTKFHTDRNEAERQYCLFRAAAATSQYEVDTAVFMTVDGFVLESKTYTHAPAPAPAPEPEPEPEPEVEESAEPETPAEPEEEQGEGE